MKENYGHSDQERTSHQDAARFPKQSSDTQKNRETAHMKKEKYLTNDSQAPQLPITRNILLIKNISLLEDLQGSNFENIHK